MLLLTNVLNKSFVMKRTRHAEWRNNFSVPSYDLNDAVTLSHHYLLLKNTVSLSRVEIVECFSIIMTLKLAQF